MTDPSLPPLDACPGAVYACAPDGALRSGSPGLEAITGRPVASVLAGAPPFADVVHPSDRARVARARAGAAPGDVLRLEYRLVRADGATRWVADAARAQADGGQPLLAGVLVDRTDAHLEALDAVDDAVGAALADQAAGLAHELNNPLTGVVNFAHLATRRLGPDADPRLREALEGIRAEGRRLQGITRGLQTLATRRDEPTPLAPGDAVRAALTPLRRRLREEFVRVELEVDEALPPVANRQRDLQRALGHVFEAARRALAVRYPDRAPGKTLAVRARHEESPPPGRVLLDVVDGGAGVDPADRPRLHEPLHDEPSGRAGPHFAAARRLVDRIGGELTVASDPAGGATVTLAVPVWA